MKKYILNINCKNNINYVKILLLSIVGMMGMMSCSKDDDVRRIDCQDYLEKTALNDSTKKIIDSVFSDYNPYFNTAKDTTLLIINDKTELSEITHHEIMIDFEKYTLIGVKILSPSISDSLAMSVISCSQQSDIICEVTHIQCKNCWTAVGNLYTWGIYPKIKQSIDLQLK